MLEWRWSKYEETYVHKRTLFHVEEELFVSDKTECIAKILDVKYKLANLKDITAELLKLTANQQEQFYNCLNNRIVSFVGMLGLWKGDLYKIKLWDSVQHHHAKTYGVPQAYEKIFKHKVER